MSGAGQRLLAPDPQAFFKKYGGKWRRFRHSLKEAQDPEHYADKAAELAELHALEKHGHLDVFYGDESGFCLVSAIPYGWQFPGEHVATRPRRGPRFNVLGFYNAATNELCANACEGSMNAAFVVETIDAWAAMRTRPTVLVLDNASLHHAAVFRARLQAWEDQDVHLFHLPTYSPHLQPHLNKIETLWRKIKCEWLRPEAYANFNTLKTAIWFILDRVGQQFKVKFAP